MFENNKLQVLRSNYYIGSETSEFLSISKILLKRLINLVNEQLSILFPLFSLIPMQNVNNSIKSQQMYFSGILNTFKTVDY